MARYYKLNDQIREFIIEQKKAKPNLSCRSIVSLIKEHFNLNLSKSLINNVIKESNLSSPVGRRRVKEGVLAKEAVKEIPDLGVAWQIGVFMENCGFFFLKAADFKLGLTSRLVELLSGYFPGLSKESHQAIIETLIYTPYFRERRGLWLLVGREVIEKSITQYAEQLNRVPFLELKELVNKVDMRYKSNDINELWSESLLQLNAYTVNFFPPEYQSLDFSAMQERFYCLPGRIEKKGTLLIIRLIYPKDFFWLNDIIWLEGFSCAAKRVNDARILTSKNEQIWINPQVDFP